MHPLLVSLKKRYNKQKPPKPFAYLFQYFNIVPKGVFQVGANSGREIKEFVAQGLKKGIFVEPLPDVYKKLDEAVAPYPGFFAVNSVCTDTVGETCNFYISTSGSMGESSSILKPTGVLTLYPEVPFDTQPITLKSTTVDQIVADFKAEGRTNIIESMDMLYLDTQGSELTVLKGASELLKQVRCIYTEVSLGGLYENDVTHIELTSYLNSHGFSLAFLYMNKKGWGDALYIHNSLFD